MKRNDLMNKLLAEYLNGEIGEQEYMEKIEILLSKGVDAYVKKEIEKIDEKLIKLNKEYSDKAFELSCQKDKLIESTNQDGIKVMTIGINL